MAAATALPGFGSVSSAPAKQIIPDAGVFAQTTIAGSVQGDSPSLYVPYISTRAAASIVAEGAAINESDTKPLELAIRTQKVAVLNVFSNESGAQSAASNGNVGGSGIDVVGMLTDGMKKTIIDKANAILWQNPAPTEGKPETAPTGLFNYPGIIQGGNITNTLDPIVDAIASISTNGGAPNGLVMNYGGPTCSNSATPKDGSSSAPTWPTHPPPHCSACPSTSTAWPRTAKSSSTA